jgi:hypothetical protein
MGRVQGWSRNNLPGPGVRHPGHEDCRPLLIKKIPARSAAAVFEFPEGIFSLMQDFRHHIVRDSYEKSSKDHNQIAVTGDIVSLGNSHVVPRAWPAEDNFDFLPDFGDFLIGIVRDRGSCSHRHWSVQAFHDTTSKALVLIQQEGRVKVLSHDPIRPFAHLAGGLAAACNREDGAPGRDEEEQAPCRLRD